MACDITRRTYSRDARLFSDSAELVRIKWYRCAPGAKCLPYPSCVTMNLWYLQPWAREGVGEVYDNPPKFQVYTAPQTATGQHACTPDTAWFKDGEPYRPSDPPARRDQWGLLSCCAGGQPVGPGGAYAYGDVGFTTGILAGGADALGQSAPYISDA